MLTMSASPPEGLATIISRLRVVSVHAWLQNSTMQEHRVGLIER
uniref:Uncharacterized protein n=1 Tax=Arundo donax TaxID=35708 RepID=A0A0A9AHD9_ARUDO